jgi:hypothetical protein
MILFRSNGGEVALSFKVASSSQFKQGGIIQRLRHYAVRLQPAWAVPAPRCPT